jgi:hypothetical protein
MKIFLKNNWFKVIVAMVLLGIGGSVIYYFTVYLPKGMKEKESLANQIKCQQDGMELYKFQVKEQGQGSYGNPEFKFNDNLKTCLYKNIYISQDYTGNFIIDVYTNAEIVSWSSTKINGKWEDFQGNKEEWKKKVNLLFGKNLL